MNIRPNPLSLSDALLKGKTQQQIFAYLHAMETFLADGPDVDAEKLRNEMQGFVDYFATISMQGLSQSAAIAAGLIFSTLARNLFANAAVIDEEMLHSYLNPAITLLATVRVDAMPRDDALKYCQAQVVLASALSFIGDYHATEVRMLESLRLLQELDGEESCDIFGNLIYALNIETHFSSRAIKPWGTFYNLLIQHEKANLQCLGIDVHELLKQDSSHIFHMKVMRASLGLLAKHVGADYFPRSTLVEQLKQPFSLRMLKGWESSLGERISRLQSMQGLLGESQSLMVAMSQRILGLEAQVADLREQLQSQQASPRVDGAHARMFAQQVESSECEVDESKTSANQMKLYG